MTVHAAEGSIDLELCFQRKEVPTWGCDPTAPKTLVVEMGVKKQDGELDEEVRQMPAGRRQNLCHQPYEFHDVENEGEEGADPAPLPTDLESHIDAWLQQPLARLDAHGTILEWSEALEMVTSYRSERVVELNIHQLAPTFKTNAWGWQKCLKKLERYGYVDASTFTNRVEMGLVLNGRYGTSRLIPVEFSGEPSWMEMRIPDSQWGSVAAQWKAVHTTMEEDAISQYMASNPQVTSKVRRKLERRRTYVQTKLAESVGWTAKIDYAADHSIGIEHYTHLTDSLPEAERGRMPTIGSVIDVRDRETQEVKRIPFEATAGRDGTVLVTAFGCGAGKSYQKMVSLYKREIAEADAKGQVVILVDLTCRRSQAAASLSEINQHNLGFVSYLNEDGTAAGAKERMRGQRRVVVSLQCLQAMDKETLGSLQGARVIVAVEEPMTLVTVLRPSEVGQKPLLSDPDRALDTLQKLCTNASVYLFDADAYLDRRLVDFCHRICPCRRIRFVEADVCALRRTVYLALYDSRNSFKDAASSLQDAASDDQDQQLDIQPLTDAWIGWLVYAAKSAKAHQLRCKERIQAGELRNNHDCGEERVMIHTSTRSQQEWVVALLKNFRLWSPQEVRVFNADSTKDEKQLLHLNGSDFQGVLVFIVNGCYTVGPTFSLRCGGVFQITSAAGSVCTIRESCQGAVRVQRNNETAPIADGWAKGQRLVIALLGTAVVTTASDETIPEYLARLQWKEVDERAEAVDMGLAQFSVQEARLKRQKTHAGQQASIAMRRKTMEIGAWVTAEATAQEERHLEMYLHACRLATRNFHVEMIKRVPGEAPSAEMTSSTEREADDEGGGQGEEEDEECPPVDEWEQFLKTADTQQQAFWLDREYRAWYLVTATGWDAATFHRAFFYPSTKGVVDGRHLNSERHGCVLAVLRRAAVRSKQVGTEGMLLINVDVQTSDERAPKGPPVDDPFALLDNHSIAL